MFKSFLISKTYCCKYYSQYIFTLIRWLSFILSLRIQIFKQIFVKEDYNLIKSLYTVIYIEILKKDFCFYSVFKLSKTFIISF